MKNLSDKTIEKFQKLFTGFTKAYGTFEINKSNNDKKKEREQEKTTDNKKIGRNEKCPCGSGKKYKHCCGSI